MGSVKIGSVAQFCRGVSYKKEQARKTSTNEFVAILRANNIIENRLDFSDLVYVPSSLVQESQYINHGDIIVTMSSGSKAHVGKVALAEKQLNCSFGAFCGKIVPQNIVSKYLYYILQSNLFRRHIEHQCKGTNINNIRQSYILDYEIELPSVQEQERIVSRIEELFSQLDASVSELKTAKERLKVYRQAVLKEAFSICPEKIPLNSVCEHITDGDHMPPPKSETGIPFVMISNIRQNRINWSNTAYVNENYYKNIDDKRRPKNGDVLYTVTGSFGIPVLVDFDKHFCFQRHIALLRPNKSISQKYLYYALQEPSVYSQASKMATGTAQKTVGLAVLRKIIIPYTRSIEAREKIAFHIESHLSVCDNIEKTVDAALQQAEALRQSILKKAFEGRL